MSRFLRPLRQLLGRPPGDAAEEVWRLRHLRRLPRGQPGTVAWRGTPLRFADGAAAHRQLQEIFVTGVYDFATATAEPRIIDAGAHIGLAVRRWRELHPRARITALEADPAIAGLLRENLAAAGDASTVVKAAAAWTVDTPVDFAATGADDGHVRAGGSQQVPACDLAQLCREPVDLLKLDIEGAEEPVLLHLAARDALRSVRRLVCEWHQWTPGAMRLHVVLDQLARHGFIYRLTDAHSLGDGVSPGFSRLAWPGNHVLLHAWQPDVSAPPA